MKTRAGYSDLTILREDLKRAMRATEALIVTARGLG
jgi:hypothetical protein